MRTDYYRKKGVCVYPWAASPNNGIISTSVPSHVSVCRCVRARYIPHAPRLQCCCPSVPATHNQLLTFIPKCFPHTYNTACLQGSVTERRGEERGMEGGMEDGEKKIHFFFFFFFNSMGSDGPGGASGPSSARTTVGYTHTHTQDLYYGQWKLGTGD